VTALLPMSYVLSVVAAGGTPVLLPPAGDAAAMIALLDALIVPGGPDVDPARYGAPRHHATQPSVPERDEFEADLLAAVAERHLPTLCICRGAQLLNVVRGGTLHQHLPDVVGSTRHAPGDPTFAATTVRVEPSSRLANVLGDLAPEVACHHHQAVDAPGSSLVPVAWAGDGTIEALEDPAEPALLAVQWHPEEREELALFRWLVNEAATKGS
jgi:putative glutamine amidotransferase